MTMKTWGMFGIVFAVAIGALLPLQALINARLCAQTQGPLYASFVSFLVGTCLLGVLVLATRTPLLPAQPLAALPAWLWLGGAIGAAFVFAATLLVPSLGAGALICLVVLGQVIGSLAFDHYGVLGAQRPVDALRVLGALLVIVGAALVVRPWQSS
jgi:bacterial/archaeal transporter family-2 protein